MAAVQLFARANINGDYRGIGEIVEIDRAAGQELVNNGRAKWVTGEGLDTPEGSVSRSRASRRTGRKETR